MQNLLAVEVTRKQFLQYSFAAILSVFGLAGLIAQLTGKSLLPHTGQAMTPALGGNGRHGFGSSKFGV